MMNFLLLIGTIWLIINVVNYIILTLYLKGRLTYELNAVKPISGSYNGSWRKTLRHRYAKIAILIGVLNLLLVSGIEVLHLNQGIFSMAYFVAFFCITFPAIEIAWFNLQATLHGPKDMSAASMREATIWIGRFYRYPMSLNGIVRQRLRYIMFSTGVTALIILATILLFY